MHQKETEKLLQNVKDFYDTAAKEFDMTRQHGWEEFKEFLPCIKEGDQIVDLGCGNGRLLGFFKQNTSINYIGIDNSKGLLEAARKNHPYAKFLEGDLTKIPLKDQSADHAIAIASFHHLPGKELRKQCLTEIKRILKPDGTFILTVWNLFQPKYKKYIWKSRLKALLSGGKHEARGTNVPWGKAKLPRYYYAFTERELKKLLAGNGFEILKMTKGNNITAICKKSSK